MLPTLESGMRPKMEGCLFAVESGVPRATVIDGRVRHSLLLEIFTDDGHRHDGHRLIRDPGTQEASP